MSLRFLPLLICLASLLAGADAGAAGKQPAKKVKGPAPSVKIYKWVDERGVTHYGEVIPPQYRDSAATEMSRRGVAVRRIDGVLTPEERRAAQERAARELEEQKRHAALRRRDNALLNTYTSATEIEAARARTIALPKQAIRGLQPRLAHTQERLVKLEEQADKLRAAGRQVPPQLADDIDLQRQAVGQIKLDIQRHQAEIVSIQQRFDYDQKRFVELMAAR